MLIASLVLATCEKPTRDPTPIAVENDEPVDQAPECVHDEDCVLLPAALTCCIECAPAPSFEAAPSWVLDGMLIENETECAEPRHLCPEITCEPVPETCVARPACAAGRCVAVTKGCDLPKA